MNVRTALRNIGPAVAATTLALVCVSPAASAQEQDCAHLGAHGWDYAEIQNDCGNWIFATVELQGDNPPCVWIAPWESRWMEFHGWPHYAYECDDQDGG